MINEIQIDKAVNWWASAIQNPKFNITDDKHVTFNTAFTESLMSFGVKTLAPDKVELFKQVLRSKLQSEAFQNLVIHRLITDYGPEDELWEAFNESGVSMLNCPSKTRMYFKDGKVTVCYGYGAEEVEL